MENRSIRVVLKISETCPLACDYCYHFRNNRNSSEDKLIKENVIHELCNKLTNYDSLNKISKVFLSMYGGEPLSVGKGHFCRICEIIRSNLNIPCILIVQSNGVFIDEEWIKIFKKYNIKLGISSDGPKEYQNIHRKFRNGNGSFDIVDNNIRLCRHEGIDFEVSTVADPNFDPQKIWNYFVDDLGITNIDILLKDYTHDTIPSVDYVNDIANYFLKWMNIWLERDNPFIKIRIFDEIIDSLLMKNSELSSYLRNNNMHIDLKIVVSANGDVNPDEFLSSNNDFMKIRKNILKNNLHDIFSMNIFKELDCARNNIPFECCECCWSNICRGGSLLDRFSSKNKFLNKGVYCKVWRKLLSNGAAWLLCNGHDKQSLLTALSRK